MTASAAEIAYVLLVLGAGAFIRSAVGFGDALLAMPLLALVVGLSITTPLVGITSLIVSAVLLAASWRSVNLTAGWRLIVASAAGAPLGLWVLTNADEWIMHVVLGGVLVGYGAYNLLRPGLPPLRSELWAFPFGFVAGILGSAYNTSGPPVIIYGTMRRWSPDAFRATLQGFFLVNSVMIAVGHAATGLWTAEVLWLAIFSLPALALGMVAGVAAQRRISPAAFSRVVYVLLIVLGGMFLLPL